MYFVVIRRATLCTGPAYEPPPVVAVVVFAMADRPRATPAGPPLGVIATVPPIPQPMPMPIPQQTPPAGPPHPWSISRLLGPSEHVSADSSEPAAKRRRTVSCADGCTWCRKKKVSLLPAGRPIVGSTRRARQMYHAYADKRPARSTRSNVLAGPKTPGPAPTARETVFHAALSPAPVSGAITFLPSIACPF